MLKDKDLSRARYEVERAIAMGDLPKLLEMTGMLHGHFCPGVASGVKAAIRAVKELGTSSAGMEEVIAIVETNNCFSDGVQFVTGCSFGNNALIYRDYGKTAFTLARRNGEAIRIASKADRHSMGARNPEIAELFQKVVAYRQGTEADQAKLHELQRLISFKMLEISDEELFTVTRLTIEVPAYARIFSSVKCSICGEDVMEPRARVKDGKPVCVPCSEQEYYQLAGDGISLNRR